MRRALPLLLIAAAAACQAPYHPPPVLTEGEIVMDSLHSDIVGADYELYVYLPTGHADETLPVIYALDGEWNTAKMAELLEGEGVRAIIVGIGREDRRDVDYLLPGARPYYEFVTSELIPYVEARYRVDATTRTISGHSRGGLFVGLALFLDRIAARSSFARFISQDGAFQLHPDATWALEQEAFEASGGSLPVTLVVSGAACCNYDEASAVYDRIASRGYRDLDAHRAAYPQSHDEMFYPSFVDAVRIVFRL